MSSDIIQSLAGSGLMCLGETAHLKAKWDSLKGLICTQRNQAGIPGQEQQIRPLTLPYNVHSA